MKPSPLPLSGFNLASAEASTPAVPKAPLHAKLEIRGVSKTYADRGDPLPSLLPTSLTVQEGEFICIVGPSGCGKTTLLNIVAGLVPASSGQVLLEGRAVHGPGQDRMMMFQESALFPWRTVLGNIQFGLELLSPKMPRPEREERARAFLGLVGLAGFEKHYVHQLSGGMKQRVALARALAPNPSLLLMDEPFGALDAMTREQLYQDVQSICAKYRKTVFFVTHNAREAACLADRVVVFTPRPGQIVGIVPVSIPRPRDINDPEVSRVAREVSELLRKTSAPQSKTATLNTPEESCLEPVSFNS